MTGAAGSPPRPSGLATLRRVAQLARPWRRDIRYGLASGLLHQVLFAGGASLAAYVAARVAGGADYAAVAPYLIVLVVAAVLQLRTPWLEALSLRAVADRVEVDLRARVFEAVERQMPAALGGRHSGDLAAVTMGDVAAIRQFFAETLPTSVAAAVVPVAAVAATAVFAWPLAAVLLVALALAVATPAVRRGAGGGDGVAAGRPGAGAGVVGLVQGLPEIVAFGAEDRARAGLLEREAADESARTTVARHATAVRTVGDAVASGGALAVLGVGAALVRHGSLSPTLLPPAVMLALVSFRPVSRLAGAVRNAGRVAESGRRIFSLLDAPPPVAWVGPEAAGAVDRHAGVIAPGVAFRHVTFRYGAGRPPALTAVTFDVSPGATVALGGPSGAGKSTCAHLLLRLWDADSGSILVGGVDVRTMTEAELRRQVGFVPQDVYLFNTTIRDNIALSRPDAGDAEIEAAARAAQAWEFVRALPDGLDTVTGERGVQLSGGERQRIAVARAFLADPPVLVLDEPSAHLDHDNERALVAALSRLRQGRTTLIVAHRASTLAGADCVVALDAGRVVDSGPPGEPARRGAAP